MIRRLTFAALLALAGYYAVFGGEYSMLDVKRIHSDSDAARARLADLRAEAELLGDRADALENDPRALETLARERFGLIRDGEILYRFTDPSGDDAGG